MKKRALVISGGGAKGAYAGGMLEYLIKEKNYDWDIYVGTSTGALLSTLLPFGCDGINRLKKLYTNVNNDSIYSSHPFTKSNKINILKLLYRILSNKEGICDNSNLYKLITENFTYADYNNLLKLNKQVYVCVVNYTNGQIEYYSPSYCTYNKFTRMVLASTTVPVICNSVKYDNNVYFDGGVLMHVPIQYAIDLGAEEIDVIILNDRYDDEKYKMKKCFKMIDIMFRTIDLMFKNTQHYNVYTANLVAKNNDVLIRLKYLPYDITKNILEAMTFNPVKMSRWWDDGYNYMKALNNRHIESSIKFIIKK